MDKQALKDAFLDKWVWVQTLCYLGTVVTIWGIGIMDFFLVILFWSINGWAQYRSSQEVLDDISKRADAALKAIDEALKK